MASIDNDVRKYIVKKVKNPDDESQFVLVPCLTEWSHNDAKTIGQEFHFIFDNTNNNDSREIKVVDLKGGGTDDNPSSGNGHLKVERILSFTIADAKSMGQEHVFHLNNDDEQALLNDKGTTVDGVTITDGPHQKTHIRYWANPPDALEKNDAGDPDPTKEPTSAESWIKMEVFDEISVSDAKTVGQEYIYHISQPIDGSDIPTEDDAPGDDDDKTILYSPIDDDHGWRFDPLQNPIDVSWTPKDFVIYGGGGGGDNPPPYLIYSKDGLKWAKLPDANIAPAQRYLIFGGGVWLNIASSKSVYSSKDLFKTWEGVGSVQHFSGGQNSAAYGMPKTAPPDAPTDNNGKPIKKGTFVISDSNNSHIWLSSSRDKGKTWSVNKTIDTSSGPNFAGNSSNSPIVAFIKGIFYMVAFGFDDAAFDSGEGNPPVFAPIKAGVVKIWKSEDGVTWDGGTTILGDICSSSWGGEFDGAFASGPPFYPYIFPYSLVYRPKSKKYVLAGEIIGGATTRTFIAEGSDPLALSGGNIKGDTALIQTSRSNTITGSTGDFGGTNGNYYIVNNPVYRGGRSAVGTDLAVTTIQKIGVEELSWTHDHVGVFTIFTQGYLSASDDEEGVVSGGAESYFCGDTIDTTQSAGTDSTPEHNKILFEQSVPEEGAISGFGFFGDIMANNHKNKDAPEDSPGTFVFVRSFGPIQQEGGSIPAKPLEVQTSFDGSSFSIVTTPINIAVGHSLAQGAVPDPNKQFGT